MCYVLYVFPQHHTTSPDFIKKVGTEWGQHMAYKWMSTKFPGVRYRIHPTRKHGKNKDKYFVIRYQADGTRKEEKLGWSSESWTEEKAALALAGLKKAHTTGEGPSRLAEKRKKERLRHEEEQREKERLNIENVTFGKYFLETYAPISERSKKYESYHREEQHFNTWLKSVIGDLPLKNIAPFHIEKIKKNMITAKMAPRSIQYVFATVRQIWNMAKRDGLVSSDSPVKQVKVPKFDNKRLRFLTREEADKLLDNLKGRSIQTDNVALLSLHCGLRAGEIFNLSWGDVDINRGTLTLRDTKSGKTRMAFMTEQVRNMIAQLEAEREEELKKDPEKKKSNDDLVFPDRNGVKIKKISNAFSRAVDDLGLNQGISDPRQEVVFHTLRHTFASWLVENGTDLYTVKELMGHSTLAMTERYSHLGQNTLQNAVKSLGESLTKEPIQVIYSNKLTP